MPDAFGQDFVPAAPAFSIPADFVIRPVAADLDSAAASDAATGDSDTRCCCLGYRLAVRAMD